MQREKIYIQRIRQFADRINKLRYSNPQPLSASFIYNESEPIPYETALKSKFIPIGIGEEWGELWGGAWFKFRGSIPADFRGKTVGALIDLNGEGCVWKDGSPWLGLTNKIHWDLRSGKYYVPLFEKAEGGEKVDLLVEAGANGLFGSGQNDYRLQQAEIVVVHRDIIKLDLDLKVLINLWEALEMNTPRRNKIIYGLNEVCNHWRDGKGIETCLEITADLLSRPATASALTAYSIGHAHLDLAWLWPIRETRRKGGRTFATALKLMEEYPDYKFGASQPQLYEWIKTDYPELFQKIKQAIADRRWEVQGAMWVEPDMNLAGGEALIRQLMYGKRFFREEFGVDVNNLWLPDVFGYSAALPQILKKCGVDVFMTQKISWNETNLFPHHTFYWEGIDGSKILTHFLPTNDYNLANLPSQLIASEKRYAQNDVSDEFLNLYGIGDGGGGPSREHIEMGLRQQNLEGVPKFKFAFAQEFFEKISKITADKLPSWRGELYLELHRGTYTTQALMKKHNRKLEQKLHDIEFLAALTGEYPKDKIDRIWKDTLLNQFHDILPGSSINRVYKEANKLSAENLQKLDKIETDLMAKFAGQVSEKNNKFIVFNSQPWDRDEILRLPVQNGQYRIGDGESSAIYTAMNGFVDYRIQVPALGYSCIHLQKQDEIEPSPKENIDASSRHLENDLIRVEIDEEGCLTSIYDKKSARETLAGKANLLQMWEDEPNNWGAWDVNHFYRETTPEKAKLISAELESVSEFRAIIKQKFTIGNSKITQRISLEKESRLIKIANEVDWKEEHKMLRVSAEVQIQANEASFEIQFGTLKRPTHENTSWDAAKFEVSAHRFADLSQPDYGFALMNDCKYGYYVKGNILDLNLLRSPRDTDKEADLHKHTFTFAYFPHPGNLIDADVLKEAHLLNSPLIIRPIAELPEQKHKSFFRVHGDGVKIETVKPAEDGSGIILRLYETKGQSCSAWLESWKEWQKLVETDMLENDEMEMELTTNSGKLLFEPFEIRTFRLVF